MLRITLHDSARATTFKLEGKLAGAWVKELEQCWVTASSTLTGRDCIVDLRQVAFIDEAGKDLLRRMADAGADLQACSPLNSAIVAEISHRTVGVGIALGLLLLAPALQAETLRLTLKDAVQLALKQNPQVQIANLTMAQSEQETRIARAALLPQAGLRASETVLRSNIEALAGTRFPGIAQHVGPFEIFQGGAAFSTPIFDLTSYRRYKASKQNSRASAEQANSVREETAALVVSQYLGSLRASAEVTAAKSRVELAEALYNQAADLQKNGVGTGIDTLRANVQLQNEKQRRIVAETMLKTSIFGLARLLSLAPDKQIEIADTVSFFNTPAIAVNQTVAAALSSRPEMKALQFRAQAVELQMGAASAARLPTARFDGTWGYTGLTPQSAIPTYQYSGSIMIPLFTGGRIKAEQAMAGLEGRKVEQQRRQVSDLISLEVQTAAVQLDAARSEVEVANLSVTLSTEEVVQSRDRFQAGVANNLEVIQAQDALARANDSQIVALYRYNQARADLARATGQSENIYTK